MSDIEIDVPQPSPETEVRQALAEIQPWLLERNHRDLAEARRDLDASLVDRGAIRRPTKNTLRRTVNRLAGERYVITQMAKPGLDPFLALDVLYGISMPYQGEPGYPLHWTTVWASHCYAHYQEIAHG